MKSDNHIYIKYANVVDLDDRSFQNIESQVKDWGTSLQHVESQSLAYKKYILGKWLTAFILNHYNIHQDHFRNISTNNFGKPYMPGSDISFNISHSGDLVIGAATKHNQVGIDIEQFRALDWNQYEECFSAAEWRQIKYSVNPSKKLIEMWTKKESLLKADGRGLQIALSDVIIDEDHGQIKNSEKKWYLKKIEIDGYSCYVCTEFKVLEVIAKQIFFHTPVSINSIPML